MKTLSFVLGAIVLAFWIYVEIQEYKKKKRRKRSFDEKFYDDIYKL